MSDWQPIETAPKENNTEFVGYDEATETAHVTFWDSYSWYDPDDHYYSQCPDFKPTHWLPLPPFPNRKG